MHFNYHRASGSLYRKLFGGLDTLTILFASCLGAQVRLVRDLVTTWKEIKLKREVVLYFSCPQHHMGSS
jgi:hypothetical protein